MTVTIDDFTRHAERFGTEEVYETAAGDEFSHAHLSPLGLARLAHRLRKINQRWSLTPDQRATLTLSLLAERVPVDEIARLLDMTERRVWQIAEGSPGVTETGSANRMVEPENTEIFRGRNRRDGGPENFSSGDSVAA